MMKKSRLVITLQRVIVQPTTCCSENVFLGQILDFEQENRKQIPEKTYSIMYHGTEVVLRVRMLAQRLMTLIDAFRTVPQNKFYAVKKYHCSLCSLRMLCGSSSDSKNCIKNLSVRLESYVSIAPTSVLYFLQAMRDHLCFLLKKLQRQKLVSLLTSGSLRYSFTNAFYITWNDFRQIRDNLYIEVSSCRTFDSGFRVS